MHKIALIHDYFTQRGGAERVAEELYRTLNGPDLFTTVALPHCMPKTLSNVKVNTSWMQQLPRMEKLHRLYFPLYPLGVASLNLSAYDVVVSSSSSYAKGVHTSRNAAHICYCHTPTRWVWRYDDYAKREKFSLPQKIVLPVLLRGLKMWDERAARQPDQFIANSRVVAERIQAVYKRSAVVIPPPIDVERFTISPEQDDYYLVLARLVPYKRIDLAIEACTRLKRRLIVIGDGTDRCRLQAMAGPTVEFMGRLSDEEVSRYAGRCKALLFTGEEDFGMVPLELAAAGRPTIAFAGGGALETVVDGSTGCFFDQPDAQSLADAIMRFESQNWEPNTLRDHAAGYDISVFRSRIHKLLRSFGVVLDHATVDLDQAARDLHAAKLSVRVRKAQAR